MGKPMFEATSVKVKFTNGAFVPLEPVDIEEGKVLIISMNLPLELSDEERRELNSLPPVTKEERDYWEGFLRTIYRDGGRRFISEEQG